MGIIRKLIKDQDILKINSGITYDAVRCLSNVCSSDDIFVKEVLNFTPEFIPKLIKLLENCTCVE